MQRLDIGDAFDSFDEQWAPRVGARLNGQALTLAKLDGEFVWHSHEDADELFLVVSGEVDLEFRDREPVTLTGGELLVVPAGVEHRPVADGEAEVLIFEPAETRNAGDVETERTRTDLECLD